MFLPICVCKTCRIFQPDKSSEPHKIWINRYFGLSFNDLMIQDYYKEQGFDFIMLITGQIHQKIIAATKKLDDKDVEIHKKYVFITYLLSYLNIAGGGNGFDMKGKIKASQFVQKKGETYTKESIQICSETAAIGWIQPVDGEGRKTQSDHSRDKLPYRKVL